MTRRSSEYSLYNAQRFQRSLGLRSVQNIFEIVPAVHFVPKIRPRRVKSPEAALFKKVRHDLSNKSIILMKNVVIDPSKQNRVAKGGEDIHLVIGQTEKDEEITVQNGFFSITSKELPNVKFPNLSHFNNWFAGISKRDHSYHEKFDEFPFTVLVRRGDYANLYWTLMELYNTYLTVRLLNENPKATNVIMMDAHPSGKLDNLWSLLFGNIYRIGHMSKKSFHKKLAWVIPISDGPMLKSIQKIPFVEDFKFSLYQGVQNSISLYHNCTDIKKVTFILRKDYVAHPRNQRGKVQRKLSNENEVMDYLTKNLTKTEINPIQIDLLPIEEQIKIIYETSILIGIHGAGLAHTLLLRSGSTLIELFPSSYKRFPNKHFQQFAYWADAHYDRWYSRSPQRKNDSWVYVEPDVPYKLIKHAVERFCKNY
ncbi:XYLT [Mytilus coruscus]|uniref:EGF domain-specific O-linked N-acetylglucosamine transferase n=1 Tax=Mytilus coruscus TaxID=42192 RepID=A0A6J8AG70_MYTCO|nr:XYLT [Mytilus coruscus]